MAALQHSLVALHCKSPPSPAAVTSISRSLPLRFSASFRPLRLRLRSPPLLRGRLRRSVPTMSATPAVSYATALADIASSNSTLEATSSDLEKISELFSDPSVFSYFTNPTVDPEQKKALLIDYASATNLQTHTKNFLCLLVDMKRIDILEYIVREYEAAYNRLTGTELALVTSVVQLESNDLAQIAKSVQKLTGAKNVRIKTAIDPSLIAGFTIQFGPSGSKLIDMSVKKQLEEITSQLEIQIDLVGA